MKDKLFIIILIFSICSCNQQVKELKFTVIDDDYFFTNNKDTIKLGVSCFNKNLFQGLNTELFPNIQYDGMQPPQEIDAYSEIEGIYINSKFYDCFELQQDSMRKINNAFDILFIYPEVSRYNFQFHQILGYRVFHYLGFLYQEPSCRQNLPSYVQYIAKRDDNSLLITYIDKSNYLSDENKIDTLVLTTFPTIRFEFTNNELKGFQQSADYIKLANELIEDVSFSVFANALPQDIIELYMREIVTRLVNLKFKSKFKTNDIIGVLY